MAAILSRRLALITEMGLCKENHILFFLNLYQFKGFGANRLVKEFATKIE